MKQEFNKIDKVTGTLKLPGDKSISHRSVMFAAMAGGKSIIKNCSNSEDVTSSIECFSKLGVKYENVKDVIYVNGKGLNGFSSPNEKLNAGNSGTTARLITGILSAQNFTSNLIGDDSLSKRPMLRVVNPLRLMGADIETSPTGTLPLKINPTSALKPIDYQLEVASAQVKSAIILAAVHLKQTSKIIENISTRDHTEKMLDLRVEKINNQKIIYASAENYPKPFEMTVPSDISSAAFFIVLCLLSKNSSLIIKDVSLNETRTGVLEVLIKMGGRISIENEKNENGEKRGDIRIESSKLINIEIPSDIIPNIIDEIPILAIAGLFAESNFKIKNAKELRVKESDRIKSICYNLKLAGLNVIEYEDGFEIFGNLNEKKVEFDSFGDHRIAMAFAILSLLNPNGGVVNNFESVGISNPDFINQLKDICF